MRVNAIAECTGADMVAFVYPSVFFPSKGMTIDIFSLHCTHNTHHLQ